MPRRSKLHRLQSFGLALLLMEASAALAQSPDIIWQRPGGEASAFSPGGSSLAVGATRSITLYQTDDGAPGRTFTFSLGEPNSIAFSPDSTLLAVGLTGFNLNLLVFRVEDGVRLLRTTGHNNGTQAVTFSPDGTLLVSAGRDREIKFWRVSDLSLRLTIDDGSRVFSTLFTPDGGTIISGDQAGRIRFWRVSDGALLRTLTQDSSVGSLALSGDGSTLVSTGSHTIQVWRVATGTLERTIEVAGDGQGVATSVALSNDNETIVASTSELIDAVYVGLVRFWRVSDGALLLSYDLRPADLASDVHFAPDNQTFTFGLSGVTTLAKTPKAVVAIHDLISAWSGIALVAAIPNPTNGPTMLRFTVSRSGPGTVRVFDIGGRVVRTVAEGVLTAGSHDLAWNGRDDADKPVPGGVYFVRLRQDGAEAMCKIILTR